MPPSLCRWRRACRRRGFWTRRDLAGAGATSRSRRGLCGASPAGARSAPHRCPRPGPSVAVERQPFAVLALHQTEHPQGRARLAHQELPVPHARDRLGRQAAADQRRLHRVGARTRQAVRRQRLVVGHLARADMADHLRGQEAVGRDRGGQLGQRWRRQCRPARRCRCRTAARGSRRWRSGRPSAPAASAAAARPPRPRRLPARSAAGSGRSARRAPRSWSSAQRCGTTSCRSDSL